MNRLAAISKAFSWLSLSCVGIVVVKQTLSQAIGAGVNVRRLTPGQGAHNPQNRKTLEGRQSEKKRAAIERARDKPDEGGIEVTKKCRRSAVKMDAAKSSSTRMPRP